VQKAKKTNNFFLKLFKNQLKDFLGIQKKYKKRDFLEIEKSTKREIFSSNH
jgi:hypothetical protein